MGRETPYGETTREDEQDMTDEQQGSRAAGAVVTRARETYPIHARPGQWAPPYTIVHSDPDAMCTSTPQPRGDGGCAWCGMPVREVDIVPQFTGGGHAIVAIFPTWFGNESWIVLAYARTSTQPWVTWEMTREGITYWGHYFDTEDDAKRDFVSRCGGL